MTLEVNLDLFDMLEVIVPTLGSLMADTNRSEPRIHGVSCWIYPRVLRLATVIDMFLLWSLGWRSRPWYVNIKIYCSW